MANILYIVQYFSMDNEPGGAGQRHYKHVRALAAEGHFVTVLTGSGHAFCSRDPRAAKTPVEQHVQPGLRIIRLPVLSSNRGNGFQRIHNELAFGMKALLTGLRLKLEERRKYDYVLGSLPSLPVALAAYGLSIVNRADFYLDVNQLWSRALRVKNRWLLALNRGLESLLYRKARKIIVTSAAFIEPIELQTPCVHHKIEAIPNGADMDAYQYPQLCRDSYLRGTPEDQALFHVNFAGTFDEAANLEMLLAVAAVMQDRRPDVRFNLAGGGPALDGLKATVENFELWNVKFWDPIPANRISKFLMEGDLSIVNFRSQAAFARVLPTKLFDYLAAGRPILAAVPQGETSRVLKQSKAGIHVKPEDIRAMVDAICWFRDHPAQGLKMGVQGYNYVCRYFDRKEMVERLLKLFPRVIPMHPVKRSEGVSSGDIRIANIQ